MRDFPTLAISVRQPWAWAIAAAGKDIENRSSPQPWLGFVRTCAARGVPARVFVHAAKGCTGQEYDDAESFMYDLDLVGDHRVRHDVDDDEDDERLPELWIPELAELPRGAIVGSVTIVEVVRVAQLRTASPWAVGEWCLVLADFEALPVTPCKGALGLWTVPPPVRAAIARAA